MKLLGPGLNTPKPLHRLEGLDAGTTEARAGQLLHGLGFTKTMQNKRVRSSFWPSAHLHDTVQSQTRQL